MRAVVFESSKAEKDALARMTRAVFAKERKK